MEREQVKIKVREFNIPYCQQQKHHRDYLSDEICMDKNCPDYLSPICSVCKFENHQRHQTQQIKLFFLDLVNECFKEVELQVDFDDLKISQTKTQLEQVVQNCQKLKKLCEKLIDNAQDIYDKYKNVIFKEAPQKSHVKSAMNQILQQQDYKSLKFYIKNLKGQIYQQNMQTFIDNRFNSTVLKNNALFNAETIVNVMNSNINKINDIFSTLIDASNPLKINRYWIDKFRQIDFQPDSFQKITPIQIYTGDKQFNPNQKLSESLIQSEIQQKSNLRSSVGGLYASSIFDKNQYKSGDDLIGSQYSIQSSAGNPQIQRKKQIIIEKIQNLKSYMNSHTFSCPLFECRFVVDDMLNENQYWKIIKHRHNLLYQIKCDQGQQLNNEMRLLGQEFKNIK